MSETTCASYTQWSLEATTLMSEKKWWDMRPLCFLIMPCLELTWNHVLCVHGICCKSKKAPDLCISLLIVLMLEMEKRGCFTSPGFLWRKNIKSSCFPVKACCFLGEDLTLAFYSCILYGKYLDEFRMIALPKWDIPHTSSIWPLTYFCKSNRNHIKTYPLQGCPLHNAINIG